MSGLFGRNSSQVSKKSPVLSSLRVTTAVAGKPIPVLYGKTRVAPNLIQYIDFQAISKSSNSSAGGKGGGGGSASNNTTTVTYQAAIIAGICQGPINMCPNVWKNKTQYANAATTLNVACIQTAVTSKNGTATVVTMVNAASFQFDEGVIVSGAGIGGAGATSNNTDNTWVAYRLVSGTDYTVSAGVYTLSAAFCTLYPGCVVQFQYAFSMVAQTNALPQAGLSLLNGSIGQSAWSYMVAQHPTLALGYSGVALAVASAYVLDDQGSFPNTTFEVDTLFGFNGTVRDANPKDILYDVLTNPYYGCYYPSARIGDLSNWSSYCVAAYIFLSPAFTDQKRLQDIVTQLMKLTNSNCFFSERQLKVVPYGDTAIASIYGTWTPNLTAVYQLTDDSYLPNGGSNSGSSSRGDGTDGPVQLSRKSPADRYNVVDLTIYDRAMGYNENVIESKDQASIDKYGILPSQAVDAYEICDPNVARQAGQLIVQRNVYVNNTYTFILPFSYALLEPMDLVTLTDVGLGLVNALVRIIQIDEDDSFNLTITAEEVLAGHASATQYAAISSTGYVVNYNTTPLNVQPPVFFEPPVSLAGSSGLAVWCAVNGQASDAAWGGCDVWVSSDGTNYKKQTTIHAGSRYGQLTAACASGADALFTGAGATQQFLPGTSTDANNKATLCWMSNASAGGEFFSYVGATLTGTYAYDLGGLVRGQYGSGILTAPIGANLVRCDANVMQGPPLDLGQIGSTIYFKFTSFNIYGGGEQSLASVPAYTYTVTGAQTLLPPSNVASITETPENFVIRVSWPLVPDLDIAYYRLRYGTASTPWAAGIALNGTNTQGTHISGDSYAWGPQLAGTYKLMIKAVSSFGVESVTEASVTFTVAVPAPTGCVGAFNGANYTLSWTGVEGNFQIAGFNVYTGATFGSATKIGKGIQSNQFTAPAQWIGTQKFYITALDANGNESASTEVDLVVAGPGVPTNFMPTTIDNNVLFYWAAPATGTLPVAKYTLSKGATFAGSAVIGSMSGITTFDSYFESSGGSYTYWLTATDSAGNVSSPAGISITVGAPPNYILQADVHTLWGGAMVNMFAKGGSPTTMNPNDRGVNTTLTNNVLANVGGATTGVVGRAFASKETGSGMFYAEARITAVGTGNCRIGVAQSNALVTADLGSTATSWAYDRTGIIVNNGSSSQTGLATATTGDTIGMAFNSTANTLQFYKNGTALGTAVSLTSTDPWFPALEASNGVTLDFNFGERQWNYSPPSGFFAWTQGGQLFGPVNTTETTPQHGTNNSWTNAAAQVTAGFPLYFEPNVTSGSYEEVYDYGTTIASSLIGLSWTAGPSGVGTVTITPKISVSNTGPTGPWTDYPGVTTAFATTFRWAKLHLDFAATAGANLVNLSDMEFKLSLKTRSDSGSGSAVSTDSGGTVTNFNINFTNVTSITVTPVSTGSTSITAVVNFTSTPSPTSFQVLLYNSTTGARVSGAYNWQATGV